MHRSMQDQRQALLLTPPVPPLGCGVLAELPGRALFGRPQLPGMVSTGQSCVRPLQISFRQAQGPLLRFGAPPQNIQRWENIAPLNSAPPRRNRGLFLPDHRLIVFRPGPVAAVAPAVAIESSPNQLPALIDQFPGSLRKMAPRGTSTTLCRTRFPIPFAASRLECVRLFPQSTRLVLPSE